MFLKLERLRENKMFMKHVRFDVTPQVIFRPRFISPGQDRSDLINETQGFMFYIDCVGGSAPSLMVMKTYNLTSKTVGEVVGTPPELLLRAVGKEGVKDYCGMYPIDRDVEAWIRENLGLTSPSKARATLRP